MGQKSLCLLFLHVQCQLKMNWTSTDDIWLLLWQSLTKTMFGHSCLPREHPTPSQLPLHSVKNGQQILIGTYFYPEDSLTNNIVHPTDHHHRVLSVSKMPNCRATNTESDKTIN